MSLRRIAQSLNISVTTASRALGGFSDVAPETRERVRAEAERLGYRPNAAARRLRGGTSDAVGVVLPTGPGQLEDAFFLRLLGAIGPKLAAAGLDLIVGTARAGEEEQAFYRQMVENRRVDAVILARTRRQDPRVGYLLDSRMPFVVHGRTEEARPHAHVDVDGEAAFRLAARRLIAAGHRRIGLLGAPRHYSFGHHRALGYEGAMAEAGLPPGPLAEAEPTEENGFRLLQGMLANGQAPTALLCATDRLAVGALRAAAQAGLRVGHDLAVIGYDNLPVATYTDPPLTTFDPDVEHSALRMVEMLLELLRGASPAGMAELRQARLIVRASDGPAPESACNDRQQSRRQPEETQHEEGRPIP
ncbi:LacI family DNA-binding transcriptional regulator [Pseudoroseomonas wenyumeiae]|uniref:LacI family DNA-binding transcriptional regulator n=1 Tax=Teichococcus wenyumeiae TaxID=2478470 RepID=A0A3A9JBF1_9PROT|nr:substrate-binding domain-containing protein [Pseudoroseomonas wenyumeiae]RKK03450.1 LacI family transcriptional regulator [Pseudoroseomonas wenyumeiae]RMI27093.1 LacI family DNA-binding transcriptional regulator [Pseudoroseomonas wenyumeiae]